MMGWRLAVLEILRFLTRHQGGVFDSLESFRDLGNGFDPFHWRMFWRFGEVGWL